MKRKCSRIGLIVIGLLFLGIVHESLKESHSVLGKKSTYTVVFNANGGKGVMQAQTIKASKKTMLRKSTFYKKGYIFQGWALSKKGKVKYKDKSKINNLTSGGGKINLYAKWKKDGTRRAIIIGETSSSAVSEYTLIQVQETMFHSKFYGRSFSKDLVYYYADRTKGELKKYISNVCKNNKTNDITYIYNLSWNTKW